MKQDTLTLKKRSDFQKIAKEGQKWVCPFFILQVKQNDFLSSISPNTLYYGVTASKKVGNAVKRNRAKRRMRALVAEFLATQAKPEFAYVVVAREKLLEASYAELQKNMLWCLKKLGCQKETDEKK